ncbi:MAG TPA: MBL fold metallo-hydrolase, partial [Candidatus Kapabacteria bacterium]|nr:MBL fold metallo-hydrolase [Candidatus Kapabacteria bacterium]
MEIKHIGHAGFLVSTQGENILMDPWLNPAGAYAASWFSYPSNELIDPDRLEIADYLYISHWHQDHFDTWFLRSRSEEFKKRVVVLISDFKYKKLRDDLKQLGYATVIELNSTTPFQTQHGTEIRILREENPFFVDSAILVSSRDCTFLNENDCKLPIEQEAWLRSLYGSIDIFTAQFSGATFHPTCYTNYSENELKVIAAERRKAKFQRIIDSMDRLNAKHYIPSAGPACFLSDDLFHLNNNPNSIFPTSSDLKEYIASIRPDIADKIIDLSPAETLSIKDHAIGDAPNHKFISRATVDEYLGQYKKRKSEVIAQELRMFSTEEGDIITDAKKHFQHLLEKVPTLATEANCILEVVIAGIGNFHVDTSKGVITTEKPESSLQHYTIELTPFWMRAIIKRLISWEDFILSFRFKISRTPDIYNEAIIAFLHLETEEERSDYVAYRKALRDQKPDRICRW